MSRTVVPEACRVDAQAHVVSMLDLQSVGTRRTISHVLFLAIDQEHATCLVHASHMPHASHGNKSRSTCINRVLHGSTLDRATPKISLTSDFLSLRTKQKVLNCSRAKSGKRKQRRCMTHVKAGHTSTGTAYGVDMWCSMANVKYQSVMVWCSTTPSR